MKLSKSEVRRLAIACQGLDGRWHLPAGKAGAAEIIRRLGYVQIDTLHVVHRAHHHVIWSRYPAYEPSMLHELLTQDRHVFEWWTHAAAYIPMDDFRFYATRMGNQALRPGHKTWIAENQEVLDHVLSRVEHEGALGTSAFKAPEGFKNGSWWSGWKPAKRALEVMFNQGVLLVSERRNFERLYDLRERIVPEGADQPVPGEDETSDFLLRRVLSTLGAVPASQLRWWRWPQSRLVKAALQRALDDQLVTPVDVEGQDTAPWYVWTASLDLLNEPLPITAHDGARVCILSPFDNLIIRRPLMEMVFGFDYRMECYVPKAKRQYGYFSLPILWGERFIGRVDTKADRASKTLILRHLAFEPDFTDYQDALPLLARELRAFAQFNTCDSFAVERVTPSDVEVLLSRELSRV